MRNWINIGILGGLGLSQLLAAEVPCVRTPAVNEKYQLYQAFYRDPDGYMIEIQRFLDPAWSAS